MEFLQDGASLMDRYWGFLTVRPPGLDTVQVTLGARPWFGQKLMAAKAGSLFDADGSLTDAATRERLAKYLAGFVESLGSSARAASN